MINQSEIQKHSQLYGVGKNIIDKDWILGHFLNAMYSIDDISQNFIFKGGTCLRKCFVEGYRFSEDLDFTMTDKDYKVDKSLMKRIAQLTAKNSGAKLSTDYIKEKESDDVEQGYEIRVKFWGADHKPNKKPLSTVNWPSFKLDLSFSEKIFLPVERKKIFHPYTDKFLINNEVFYL